VFITDPAFIWNPTFNRSFLVHISLVSMCRIKKGIQLTPLKHGTSVVQPESCFRWGTTLSLSPLLPFPSSLSFSPYFATFSLPLPSLFPTP